jgi:hypothetical protein
MAEARRILAEEAAGRDADAVEMLERWDHWQAAIEALHRQHGTGQHGE